jgi:FMN phosphatase YigB (HAD superfamily)
LKLFRDAIADLAIDPSASVFVGDRWRDVAPATALGGRPIFLDVASSPPADRQRVRAEGLEVAHSLGEAVDRFLDALPAPSGGP